MLKPAVPPLAHRILWSLDDAFFKLSLTYSIRRWMLRDLLTELRLKRLARESRQAQRRAVQQSLDYLQRAAYIVRQPKGSRPLWRLTPAGQLQSLMSAVRALRRYTSRGRGPRPTQRRQWIVLFDIPEELRRHRALVRQVLYGLDGRYIQRSAFLLATPDGVALLEYIIRRANLTSYFWIAEVNRKMKF